MRAAGPPASLVAERTSMVNNRPHHANHPRPNINLRLTNCAAVFARANQKYQTSCDDVAHGNCPDQLPIRASKKN
jgi:hypothetical protein